MAKVSISRCASDLFTLPVALERKPSRKTYLTSVSRDSSGEVVVSSECVEDVMSKIIPLDFQDLTLSNLVEKGVDPHSLDMIDTNRMGADAGADELYHHIVSNSDKYVVPSKND